jgi:hypothetical protein
MWKLQRGMYGLPQAGIIANLHYAKKQMKVLMNNNCEL